MLVVSTICCNLLTGRVRTVDHSMMTSRLSANMISAAIKAVVKIRLRASCIRPVDLNARTVTAKLSEVLPA